MTDSDGTGPLTPPTTDLAGSGTPAAAAPRRGAPEPGTGRAPRPSGSGVRFDEDQPVTVVLVRHGQTTMTVSRGYSGSSEPGPPLDEHGERQAQAAAVLVDRIGQDLWGDVEYPTEVVASPMVRTQQTAGIVAGRLGLPVRTLDLVKEADFGEWQGLTAEQIEERWPGLLEPWHTSGDLRPPGGESIADVGDRLRQLFDQLLSEGTGRTVVVVSHAVAIRAALGVAMGAQPGSWSQLRVAPASVSIVRLFADRRHEIAVVGVPSEGW